MVNVNETWIHFSLFLLKYIYSTTWIAMKPEYNQTPENSLRRHKKKEKKKLHWLKNHNFFFVAQNRETKHIPTTLVNHVVN